MYNKRFLDLAAVEIEAQVLLMPRSYTSFDYYTNFERNYRGLYEQFVRIYTDRQHDRAHAIKIVHSQLMHTINHCFQHFTRKVRTVHNPKGGDMSEWARV